MPPGLPPSRLDFRADNPLGTWPRGPSSCVFRGEVYLGLGEWWVVDGEWWRVRGYRCAVRCSGCEVLSAECLFWTYWLVGPVLAELRCLSLGGGVIHRGVEKFLILLVDKIAYLQACI